MSELFWIVVGLLTFMLLNCLWVGLFITVEMRGASASNVEPAEERIIYLRLDWRDVAHHIHR
jgi:hypothetical protein